MPPHRRQPTRLPHPWDSPARTLEWVAISFSSAWKWKVKGKSLGCVWLLATPWTAAYQVPPSMGFSRQEYWSGVPLPSPSLLMAWVQFLVGELIFHKPQDTAPHTKKPKTMFWKKKCPKFKHLGCLLATLLLSCMNRNLNKMKSLSSRSLRAKGRKWNS